MEFQTTGKLGKVLKSHGKNGEIIISSFQELTEEFLRMESIFLKIEGGPVPFFLKHARLNGPYTATLKLYDIDSVEAANELAGGDWFLSESEHKKWKPNDTDSSLSYKGYMLVDQNEHPIGVVEEISKINPSNKLIHVWYQNKLIDIPFNEHTFYWMDEKKQIVKTHIPEGLLEI
jgi:16S rRNA processing protein RimM